MTSTLDQELADAKKDRDQLLTQINKIKEQVTNLVEGQGKDIGVAEGLARTQIETRDHEKSKVLFILREYVFQLLTFCIAGSGGGCRSNQDQINESH